MVKLAFLNGMIVLVCSWVLSTVLSDFKKTQDLEQIYLNTKMYYVINFVGVWLISSSLYGVTRYSLGEPDLHTRIVI